MIDSAMRGLKSFKKECETMTLLKITNFWGLMKREIFFFCF